MSNVFDRIMQFSTRIAMLVSSTNKVNTKTREVMLPRATRNSLVEAAQLAANRRLAVGTLAEISLRLPGGKMAISARDAWFGHIQEDDFCIAALGHERVFANNRPPSRHAPWHRLIYSATPAQVVFLCQPTAAMQLASRSAALGSQVNIDLLREAAGQVSFVHPAENEIRAAAAAGQVMLIGESGMLVWGENLIQVLALAETVNHLCEIQLGEQNLVRGNG